MSPDKRVISHTYEVVNTKVSVWKFCSVLTFVTLKSVNFGLHYKQIFKAES